MSYFNGNNKTSFHSTLFFVILLMTCASPLMLQAAGGSDDDFTSQKSIELPTSFLTILPKYLPPLSHLSNGYNLNPSTHLNNHRHPSIFQVFLC